MAQIIKGAGKWLAAAFLLLAAGGFLAWHGNPERDDDDFKHAPGDWWARKPTGEERKWDAPGKYMAMCIDDCKRAF